MVVWEDARDSCASEAGARVSQSTTAEQRVTAPCKLTACLQLSLRVLSAHLTIFASLGSKQGLPIAITVSSSWAHSVTDDDARSNHARPQASKTCLV